MTTDRCFLDPQYASVLADAITSAERALNEARMPVHILLTTQFGELNDNQEEMVGAAASALDRTAEELGALRAIVDADRGRTASRSEIVRIGELVRTLLPELQHQASQAGVSLTITIEPGLPEACGDAAQLRDAIRLTLTDDIRYATPGTAVSVNVGATPTEIRVMSRCGTGRAVTGALLLADRILSSQGARLEHGDGTTTIAVPR